MAIELDNPSNRATSFGLLTVIPLLIWWAGWYPAIMSSDSVDQWNQALIFEFQNTHPITHTISLWVVSLVWESPGAVALLQVLLFSLLLAVIARRLVQLGIRMWMAVLAVWIIALLPMTGATVISVWKDVPFTLAMGWVFTELILLAANRNRFWATWAAPTRLGVGLGLMWAFRANGKLTVLLFVVILAIGFRRYWRGLVPMGTAIVGLGIILPAVLIAVFPVTNRPIEPAQVFMPDVGSAVVHNRGALSAADLALVTAVAPFEIWESQYKCGDSSPLLFHPEYSNSVIQDDPSAYRKLVVRTVLRAPGTVASHRWCAGEYLLSPYNRTETFVHRPPFDIWQNDLGLVRDPLSDRAYSVTLWAYKVAEHHRLEWLTWRPAIYVLVALITYGAVWWRRELKPLRWIALLFAIHLANVFATSPAHEFRYAFGLYLFSLASLPLWYLIRDPSQAKIAP